MAKEYHIVCGDIAKAVLIQSGHIDFSDSIKEIICFKDNLAEGPLYDLKTLSGFDEREKRFNDFYVTNLWGEFRRENAQECQLDFSKIKKGDVVYLWLGNDSNEYVLKAGILNLLKEVDVEINSIDWEILVFQNDKGIKFNLYSLNICSFENAIIAGKNFRLLRQEEKTFFTELWGKLLKSNTDFRILMNNKLVETDVTYLDDRILNTCTNEYTKNSRVVGHILGDLIEENPGNGIGDSFVFRRIEQLVESGILEARNIVKREGCFDLFEVALAK